MRVNPEIFRGYDLRGLVGTELSGELALHLGKAYGTYLKREGITKLVVGRDCRASGEEYSKNLIEGLNWAGADVVDIGMTLVGTFYWSQYYLNRKGGVFVTASHNPPEYNGFKFANDFSETLVSAGMKELLRMVQEEDYEKGGKTGSKENIDIRDAYFADILKRVPISKKFNVLIDASSATAGALAPELLRRAGCNVIERNCKVDSSFPLGIADPTSSIVAGRLAKGVLETKADIGFTYDADGDRIGIADEKGRIIWNDVLVALFAKDVLNTHKNATIMYNLLCSKTVEETIIKSGGKPFMWRVGHSFLKKKNQEIKAAFIGELSGHFFFSKDFHNHDDGLYATLRLLHYLSESNQSLSEAVDSLPLYISSPEIKIFCSDKEKASVIQKASPVFREKFPDAKVTDDESAGDGIRLDLKNSMAVIRYSQNGPYLTIKFEGRTKTEYNELREFIDQLLHTYKEIDWHSKINLNTEALEKELS
jgi:phosphomannomutase/phosphoglucomutase